MPDLVRKTMDYIEAHLAQDITLAKSYLCEGFSITEACYQSGFSDYANFIRSFTKTVGISPGRFSRKNVRLPE
jgi:AraC-like DNA-binding protein